MLTTSILVFHILAKALHSSIATTSTAHPPPHTHMHAMHPVPRWSRDPLPSVNCIPTLSSETRQQLAMIAVGPSASNFYLSLHQKKAREICQSDSTLHSDPDSPDFTGTAWDLMRSSAMDNQSEEPYASIGKPVVDIDDLVKQIEEFTEDNTSRVKENQLIAQGMQTFLKRYQSLTESGKFQTQDYVVPFIVLDGCLGVQSEALNVDTCVGVDGFLLVLRQLVVGVNQRQGERQKSQQEDQRA